MAGKKKQEDVQEEAAKVFLGETPAEDASEAVKDELATPEGIEGAREDKQAPAPFPGDGVNTGETTPQPGPRPGVTLPELESNPEVPGDANTIIRQQRREGEA